MEITNKKLNEIHPYEKNPRKNDNAVEAVSRSIEEFGFKVPIVVDKDGTIIAGHTRFKAAKKLGLKSVPCIVADDLTEEQAAAFRLADNRVAESAEWDPELLYEELGNIFELDMEDFGFTFDEIYGTDDDEETEEDDGYYGDARERTFNLTNMNEFDRKRCAGKYEMPVIRKCDHIPTDLISFNYMLTTNKHEKGIHFYIDDYQFERIWNSPQEYIPKIAQFDCALTPDFSLYQEMPIAMQIWNTYRSRLIGQMMQDAGINVIPTLSWCTEDSFEFCFDGIEPGGTISVSTIGVKQDDYANSLWVAGMDEAIKRLKPKHIVVYGGDIGYEFGCEVTYIANHNSERFAESKKG